MNENDSANNLASHESAISVAVLDKLSERVHAGL
jgi:hypothetical protein